MDNKATIWRGVFAANQRRLRHCGGFAAAFAAFLAAEATASQTWYVAAATGSDANDGLSWETAKASIQAGIDIADDGDTIMVADGTYAPIYVDNRPIRIQSVNGPEAAIIDGDGKDRCATLTFSELDRIRPVSLWVTFDFWLDWFETNSVLVGFTLCNGNASFAKEGCSEHGGGAYGGILINCILQNNICENHGGGAYGTCLERCKVLENRACEGGGIGYCFVRESTVSSNCASVDGGGAYECALDQCKLLSNTAFSGGGGYRGIARNTLFAFNEAHHGGGLALPGELLNCTVAYNDAEINGGIQNWGFSIANCIVWGNTSGISSKVSLGSLHCCTDENVEAKGVITDDPLFVNPENGDFHLRPLSPCIDAGTGGEIMDIDLDGNPRIVGNGIDMGCYEYPEGRVTDKIWGYWSSDTSPSLEKPSNTSTWDSFARSLWSARDAFVRAGTATEVIPSTNKIVLSVGVVSVPDSMLEKYRHNISPSIEEGVPVYRIHFREETSEDNPDIRLLFMVGDGIRLPVAQLPIYDADGWTKAVYGNPPSWLSESEKADWFAARSRSRIEWMVTLVPESAWAQYAAEREADISAAEADAEDADIFRLTGLSAADGDSAHSVSVQSSSNGIVRLFGKESLSAPLWDYKGLSLQERGTTTAGAASEAKSQFFMATRQPDTNSRRAASTRGSRPGDSDGDGIPDDIERLVLGTNPHSADTSGDGLSDWDKAYRYDLNPRVNDTSGDGFSDAENVALGTDPRIPASPARLSAALHSIRYAYDDDNRLTGAWFGLGGASTTSDLSSTGNPEHIRERNAAR